MYFQEIPNGNGNLRLKGRETMFLNSIQYLSSQRLARLSRLWINQELQDIWKAILHLNTIGQIMILTKVHQILFLTSKKSVKPIRIVTIMRHQKQELQLIKRGTTKPIFAKAKEVWSFWREIQIILTKDVLLISQSTWTLAVWLIHGYHHWNTPKLPI